MKIISTINYHNKNPQNNSMINNNNKQNQQVQNCMMHQNLKRVKIKVAICWTKIIQKQRQLRCNKFKSNQIYYYKKKKQKYRKIAVIGVISQIQVK